MSGLNCCDDFCGVLGFDLTYSRNEPAANERQISLCENSSMAWQRLTCLLFELTSNMMTFSTSFCFEPSLDGWILPIKFHIGIPSGFRNYFGSDVSDGFI